MLYTGGRLWRSTKPTKHIHACVCVCVYVTHNIETTKILALLVGGRLSDMGVYIFFAFYFPDIRARYVLLGAIARTDTKQHTTSTTAARAPCSFAAALSRIGRE